MPYDRDVVVAGVTRYYTLLARMAYLDASEIQYPPEPSPTSTTDIRRTEETSITATSKAISTTSNSNDSDGDKSNHDSNGWPSSRLPLATLRHSLNRSETAIDLVRHLPYLSTTLPLWHDGTRSLSYLIHDNDEGSDSEARITSTSPQIVEHPFFPSFSSTAHELPPPSFISLTTTSNKSHDSSQGKEDGGGEGGQGTFLLLDTDTGKVFPIMGTTTDHFPTSATTEHHHQQHQHQHQHQTTSEWLGKTRGLLGSTAAGIDAKIFFDVMCERLEGLEEVIPVPRAPLGTGSFSEPEMLVIKDFASTGHAWVMRGLLRKWGWNWDGKEEEEGGEEWKGPEVRDRDGYSREVGAEREREMMRRREESRGILISKGGEAEVVEDEEKEEERERGGIDAADWGLSDEEDDGEWLPDGEGDEDDDDDYDDDEYDSEEEDSDGDSEFWSEDEWSDEAPEVIKKPSLADFLKAVGKAK